VAKDVLRRDKGRKWGMEAGVLHLDSNEISAFTRFWVDWSEGRVCIRINCVEIESDG
jgi:hypothetical protein